VWGLYWPEAAATTGSLVTPILTEAQTGLAFSTIGHAVRDDTGRAIGALVMRLDSADISRRLFEHLPDTVVASIQDPDMNVAFRSTALDEWLDRPPPEDITRVFRNGRRGNFRVRDVMGSRRIGSYTSTPEYGYITGVGYPESAVLGPIRVYMSLIGLAMLLLFALLFWAAHYVFTGIRAPLGGLVHAFDKFGSGDKSARAEVTGPLELRYVADRFNKLVVQLQSFDQERAAISRHIDVLMQNAPLAILLSDRDARIVQVNSAAEAAYGFGAGELLDRKLDTVECEPRLRDLLHDPECGAAGCEFRATHRRKDGSKFSASVHARALTIGDELYLQTFVRDVTDEEALAEERERYTRRIETTIVTTVDALSTMIELRDPYTAGHERRVGTLATEIAAEMGLDVHTQFGLRIASAVHDIGKVAIPAEILNKPGRLNPLEYELVKTHPERGYDVLKHIESDWPVAEVARQHHERLDGSGYPRHLKGDEILLEARIVAVADVVESMAAHRPYRAGLGIQTALAEIQRHRGVLYDANVVDACLRLFNEKGFKLPE
jgi:PAS domain S-box-containing protein